MTPDAPRVARLGGRFGCALTVDVEEWYHTCLVPGYVNPEGRPPLCQELDWLLPELLEMLADAGRTATFFVLGEVAERLPRRVREIAAAGHEVGSHGYLHLRATERSPDAFAARPAALQGSCSKTSSASRSAASALRNGRCAASAARACPWWPRPASSTTARSPPAPFSGRPTQSPLRLAAGRGSGPPERELLEFPPLTFGGVLRLPAGSWTGRLVQPGAAGPRRARAPRRGRAAGGGGPSLGDLGPAHAGTPHRPRPVRPRDRPARLRRTLPRAAAGAALGPRSARRGAGPGLERLPEPDSRACRCERPAGPRRERAGLADGPPAADDSRSYRLCWD